jgi:HAMP domain-containing protein
MRFRVILLVVATSTLVLVSFLVPLALVLRTFAADQAVSNARIKAQNLATLVTTLDVGHLQLTVDELNAQNNSTPVTVFLPGGRELGRPAHRTSSVQLAAGGSSFTTVSSAGAEILVSVQGLPAGTVVIRTFVPEQVLKHGVTRAWALLGGLGLGLLALSVAVADQLARTLVRPIEALARASDRLATGDLSARATVAGPPEVRRASAGLNRLAMRIGDLLTHERETVADLSHRLRTPLTALRIDAESLRDTAEMTQLSADVDAVERTVNEIIREARRPTGEGVGVLCDASQVITERAAFWRPLAEDQDRPMTPPGRTWRPALTSCWRTCSRTPPRATPSPCGSAGGQVAAPGWWSPTTARGSRTPTPSSEACPAAARPAWAWISPAGSPRHRAVRSPPAVPPRAAVR